MTTPQARIVITAEDRASEVLRNVRDGVRRASDSFKQLGAAGAAIGAGVLAASLRGIVTAIDDLDEFAQSVTVATTTLAGMQIAAAETGVTAEQLRTGLTRLNVSITEAAQGSAEQARLFKALGIAVVDAGGNVRQADAVLRDLADRFAGLEDDPQKAALAVELFGQKVGPGMLPYLNQGSAGLERFSGLSGDTVRETTRLQGEIDKLTASWQRLRFELADAVVPATNRVIETMRQLDFGRIAAELLKPGGLVKANIELQRQLEGSAARHRQLEEALRLGADAYSNEGHAARQSAVDILNRMRADEAAAKAAHARTAAINRLREAQEAERRAQIVGDAQRDLLRLQRFEEGERDADEALAERARRVADLTGQSEVQRQVADLRALREEFAAGFINLAQFDAGYRRVFGLDGEVSQGIAEAREGVQQLALTFASSLGQAIESGRMSAREFFSALSQDLLKLITQLLIVKPLAEGLTRALSGGGGGGGWGGAAVSFFRGLFGGARADGGPVTGGRAYLVGERGPELFVPRGNGQITPNGMRPISVNNTFVLQGPATRETQSQIAAAAARGTAAINRRYN